MPTITPERAGGSNACAFLDMLAYSELGENLLKHSENGYNIIVGSYWKSDSNHNLITFTDYSKHPNRLIDLPKLGIKSTAAGRYQLLGKYFEPYKKQLGLKDFGPLSQDLIALQLIRECKATSAIQQGNIKAAVTLCRSRWASLPGAGYGQNEHSMDVLINAYIKAGGTIIKG